MHLVLDKESKHCTNWIFTHIHFSFCGCVFETMSKCMKLKTFKCIQLYCKPHPLQFTTYIPYKETTCHQSRSSWELLNFVTSTSLLPLYFHHLVIRPIVFRSSQMMNFPTFKSILIMKLQVNLQITFYFINRVWLCLGLRLG